MSTEAGPEHVLLVVGLGSDGEHDPIARAATRLATDSRGLLEAHVVTPNYIERGDGVPNFVVVLPLSRQGMEIGRQVRERDAQISEVITCSLGLLAVSYASIEWTGVQLTGVVPALSPSAERVERALVKKSQLTDKEWEALIHYEDVLDLSAAGVIRIAHQPPVIISKAFMCDAQASPLTRLIPFLQHVAKVNPETPPRLTLLENDSRLSTQVEEVVMLQAAVPELVITRYKGTEDHYLRDGHARTVLASTTLGRALRADST